MGYTYFIKAIFVCHRLLPYIWWMEIAKCHDSLRTCERLWFKWNRLGFQHFLRLLADPKFNLFVCALGECCVGELWGVGQMRKLKDINRIGCGVTAKMHTIKELYILVSHTRSKYTCNAEKSSCVWHRIYGENGHSSTTWSNVFVCTHRTEELLPLHDALNVSHHITKSEASASLYRCRQSARRRKWLGPACSALFRVCVVLTNKLTVNSNGTP